MLKLMYVFLKYKVFNNVVIVYLFNLFVLLIMFNNLRIFILDGWKLLILFLFLMGC